MPKAKMTMNSGPSSPRNVMDFDRDRLPPIPSCRGSSSSTLHFPWKLHDILHIVTMEGKDHIVSWNPDGTAFKVHDSDAFVAEILPLFFKQTKFKSFQRQLNLWGFERMQHGPEKGAYLHENFLRDRPSLCRYLTRRGKRASAATRATPISKPPIFPSKIMPDATHSVTVTVPNVYDPIPRRVSDVSLRGYEDVLLRLGADSCSTIDSLDNLAEFGGCTFYLLKQDRYEELDLAFKPYYDTTENHHARQDENSEKTSLLQELELGVFGVPKTATQRFECTLLATQPQSFRRGFAPQAT